MNGDYWVDADLFWFTLEAYKKLQDQQSIENTKKKKQHNEFI